MLPIPLFSLGNHMLLYCLFWLYVRATFKIIEKINLDSPIALIFVYIWVLYKNYMSINIQIDSR